MTALGTIAIAIYMVLLAGMLAYGANSFYLAVVHAKSRRSVPPRPEPLEDAPRVTVQLPVFNEANVVARLLEAVARLDWPRDRLEIQLLDDSTDHTPNVAAPIVARLAAAGFAITHLRRPDRSGFKAGALEHGLERSVGELIAIFDADFVPPPEFLRLATSYFRDERVAAVQGRWTYTNRERSDLTRAQALGIDAHFAVEQAARCWSGWFLNFNGSAGVWRRTAIAASGGWSGDTLTEDLDLSYRAQLAGWRIVYDPDLVCPSELPIDLGAFKSQQRRWATGSIQTARKLLPSIWRSPASLTKKLQATLHLTHYAVHPLIALTALLSVPCVLVPGAVQASQGVLALLIPFALSMCGPTLLHAYAQRVLEQRSLRLRDYTTLALVGIGIAVSNASAVVSAFRRSDKEFVRTPKLGVTARRDEHAPVTRYRAPADGLHRIEAGLALYCLAAAAGLVAAGVYVIAPFMLLDAAGFAAVASIGIAEARTPEVRP